MSVTMEDVQNVLSADEPNYATARSLGPNALPHLATLTRGSDTLMASKAVYLASLIGTDAGVAVLTMASSSASPVVRLQAAAGARNIPPSSAAALLLPQLLADTDHGVRKFALRSTQRLFAQQTMPDALKTLVAKIGTSDPEPSLRGLAAAIGAKP